MSFNNNGHTSLNSTTLKWNAVVQATSASNYNLPKKNSTGDVSTVSLVNRQSITPPPSSSSLFQSEKVTTFSSQPATPSIPNRSGLTLDWKAVGNNSFPQKTEKNESISSSSAGLFNSPITQLPMSLNEAIGLDDPDEVAQIFQRTSISAPPPQVTSLPPLPLTFVPSSSNAHFQNINNSRLPNNYNRAYSISGIPSQNHHGMMYPSQHYHHPVPEMPPQMYQARRPSLLDLDNDHYEEEYYYENHNYYPQYQQYLPPRMPLPVQHHHRRHSANFHYENFPEESALYFDPSQQHQHSYDYDPSQSAPTQNINHHRYSVSSNQSEFIGNDSYNCSNQSMSVTNASFQLSSFKGSLYTVEFKAGRTELFYVLEIDGKPNIDVKIGDFVIVEADRGEDLGKITRKVSLERLKKLLMAVEEDEEQEKGKSSSDPPIEPELLNVLSNSKEIIPKKIYRHASPNDLKLLQAKAQEEAIAMVRCQSRIRQKKLTMEMIDAEYQWDRNKLTFYFIAEARIDFRELVRELFRIYKTRIWMCAVDRSRKRVEFPETPDVKSELSIYNNED